jgi:hypothetical protein
VRDVVGRGEETDNCIFLLAQFNTLTPHSISFSFLKLHYQALSPDEKEGGTHAHSLSLID